MRGLIIVLVLGGLMTLGANVEKPSPPSPAKIESQAFRDCIDGLRVIADLGGIKMSETQFEQRCDRWRIKWQ
jgi:hypothetical protein